MMKKQKIDLLKYKIYKLFNNSYTNSGIKMDISTIENFQRAKSLLSKEEDTIEWIETFDREDVFYDIGANVGVFSLYAASKCSQVLAFEPHFMNYYIINKNIYLNSLLNTYAYCLAFNEKTESGSFEHCKFSAGSSTSQFNRTIDHAGKKFSSKFSQGMLAMSLDEFVKSAKSEFFPNHIKIDVDGLEEKISLGMQETLKDRRLKSILIEITENDGSREVITDLMYKNGLRLISKGATSKITANYIFRRDKSGKASSSN